MQAELLHRGRRTDDLGSGGAQHLKGRRAHLRLLDGRRQNDPLPLPPRVPDQALRMHLVYLHGFASSARSSKAVWLGERAAEHGLTLVTPDFNQPDFEHLTITRMLAQVAEVIERLPAGPVALIGSSLGGFVAVQAARQLSRRIDRLVLLAPALDFSANRLRDLGDRGVDDWRRTGVLNVFHYGFGRLMPVHFGLYEDAAGYDALDAI